MSYVNSILGTEVTSGAGAATLGSIVAGNRIFCWAYSYGNGFFAFADGAVSGGGITWSLLGKTSTDTGCFGLWWGVAVSSADVTVAVECYWTPNSGDPGYQKFDDWLGLWIPRWAALVHPFMLRVTGYDGKNWLTENQASVYLDAIEGLAKPDAINVYTYPANPDGTLQVWDSAIDHVAAECMKRTGVN